MAPATQRLSAPVAEEPTEDPAPQVLEYAAYVCIFSYPFLYCAQLYLVLLNLLFKSPLPVEACQMKTAHTLTAKTSWQVAARPQFAPAVTTSARWEIRLQSSTLSQILDSFLFVAKT